MVATMDLATSSRTNESVDNSSLTILLDLVLRGFREESVLLDISARIEAVYSVSQDSSFSEYQLRFFAKANGMLNVWPYWRDFVQSSVTRAGLPPLTLPLFRVLHKRKPTRTLENSEAQRRDVVPQSKRIAK
jgi:preprotein translocase subunit SecB